MSDTDDRDPKDAVEAAIVRHYAREQEGLPPPVPSKAHLQIPHRDWLAEHYRRQVTRRSLSPALSQAWKYPGVARPEGGGGGGEPTSDPRPEPVRAATRRVTGIAYLVAMRSRSLNPPPATAARSSSMTGFRVKRLPGTRAATCSR